MIETVISSSVLILAVILIRLLFKDKISHRFQYSLWGIVMLRLLMPFSFLPSPVSVMNLVSPVLESIGLTEDENNDISNIDKDITTDMPVVREDKNRTIETNESGYPIAEMEETDHNKTTTIPPSKKSLDGDMLLKLIWICGAIAAGMWFLVVNLMFYIRLRRERVPFESGSEIPVYVVENIASPCLFGLFRPTIYLNPIAAEDKEMLHHVLTHETCHFRHLDHIWSFARVICCAAYWWNPLVWIAAFLSKADSERACDEACLKILGEENRLNYGRTLISMIATKPSAPTVIYTATTMTGGKKSIVRRLNIIVRTSKTRLPAIIATLVIVSFAAGCCFTGAKEGNQEKNSGFSLGNYEAVEVIYVSPTSSFDPILDESENTYRYYSFEKSCFTVIDKSGNRFAYPSDYEITKIDEDSFKEDFKSEAFIPDISDALDLHRISLYTANENDRKSGSIPTGYLMYQVDDEFWLAAQKDDYIWVIYRLKPYEGELPKNVRMEGGRDCSEYIDKMDETYTPIDKDSELYAVLYPNVEKYNADFIAESDAKLIMSGEGEYIPVNYCYIDSEILGVYLRGEYSFSSEEFNNFDSDTKWYICECPSRYKPDDLSELYLPGARWLDSEGWLHDNLKYFIIGENDNAFFYAGCQYFEYLPESEAMEQELKEYIHSIYPDEEDSSESEDYITGLETRNIVGEDLNVIATEFLIIYGKTREALPDENIAKAIGLTIDDYLVSELDENDSFIIRATFSYVPANLSEWKLKYASNDLDEEGRHTEYWEFRLQKVYSPESGSADGYVWRCTESGTGV